MDVNLLKRIADVLDKLLDGTSKAIKSVINRENYSNIRIYHEYSNQYPKFM